MNPINRFVQIVLVETSHPGNIGSVARAMKNMGLSNLCLINPKKFPHQEATALAGNATDVLDNAKIFTSIQEAVKNSKAIYATSARERTIEWPTLTAHEAASEIQELVVNEIEVSILFGREDRGTYQRGVAAGQQTFNYPSPSRLSSSKYSYVHSGGML
jgi:TrmH family RNA methyltransferase